MKIQLDETEQEFLFRPIAGQGGFQSLLARFRHRIDCKTGDLELTPTDLERIPRYAFEYGNGGWEGRLKGIFERHLGPNL